MKVAEGLSIGSLSQQSGGNIETIRYYEKIGVIPKPGRSAGGYRVYGPEYVKRLHFVRRGRELGFSLDELRGLLRLARLMGRQMAREALTSLSGQGRQPEEVRVEHVETR